MTKKHKIIKRIAISLAIFLGAIMIFAGVAAVYVFNNRESLRRVLVGSLDNMTYGKWDVSKVSLDIFAQFPRVSLQLDSLRLWEDSTAFNNELKPVINVDRAYIGVDIFKILNQQYEVSRLRLSKSQINIIQNKSGDLNIMRALTPRDDSDTTSVPINLDIERLGIRDLAINFTSSRGEHLDLVIEKLNTSLKYNDSLISTSIKTKIEVKRLPAYTPKKKKLELELESKISVNRVGMSVDISETCFKLGDIDIDIDGHAAKDHGFNLNVTCLIEGVKSINTISGTDRFEINEGGTGYVNAVAKLWGRRDKVGYKGTVDVRNLNILRDNKDTVLSDINLKLTATSGSKYDGSTTVVDLKTLTARFLSSHIDISGHVANLRHPSLHITSNSEADISDVYKLLSLKQSQNIGGKVYLKGDFHTKWNLQKINIESDSGYLALGLKKFKFHPVDSLRMLDDVSGEVQFHKDTISSKDMVFHFGNNIVNCNFKIANLAYFIFGVGKDVTLDVGLNSKSINPYRLLRKVGAPIVDSVDKKNTIKNIELELSTRIDAKKRGVGLGLNNDNLSLELNLKKFSAKYPGLPLMRNFSGIIKYQGDSVELKRLSGIIGRSHIEAGFVFRHLMSFLKAPQGTAAISMPFYIKGTSVRARDIMTYNGTFMMPRKYIREQFRDLSLKGIIDVLPPDSLARPTLHLILENFTAFTTMYPLPMNLTFDVIGRGDDFEIKRFEGYVGYSDFQGSGIAKRVVSSNGDTTLVGNIALKSHQIDLVEMMNTKLEFQKPVADTSATAVERRRKRREARKAQEKLAIDRLASSGVLATSTVTAVENNTEKKAETVVVESKTNTMLAAEGAEEQAGDIFDLDFPDLKLSLNVERLIYPGLTLTEIDGNIKISPDKTIRLTNLSFAGGGGRITANGLLSAGEHKHDKNGGEEHHDNMKVNSNILMSDVQLDKLGIVVSLDDTTQMVLSDHLRGRLNGDFKVNMSVSPDMEILMDDINVNMNFTLNDGSLINFAPMNAMSKYLKRHDLSNIRFAELANNITIKNGAINIPRMNIASTLGNFFVEGMQSFDGKMKYYLEIPWALVGEVVKSTLFGGKQREEEIIAEDPKKRRIKVTLVGTTDDFDVKLGKKIKDK